MAAKSETAAYAQAKAGMKLLRKIGELASFVIVACVAVPIAAALACLAGMFCAVAD
jgi:MFS superfamily sulfate permease-like transporter